MASGRQASFLVTRTSSDLLCPLSSEDKDAAPVNHPALVKTSDQPLFTSANFSPFTFAEHISPVPSLNIKPNPRGGTTKKK